MALTATLYHLRIDLSDVDRGVYEALDLRIARHPSESMRYMLTRTIAYCLAYEEGIAFSRGLSTAEEPAVAVRSLRGDLVAWIDVGSPSAERLHKASKAAGRVAVYTHQDPELLRRAARDRPIHRAEEIEVVALSPAFLDELEAVTDRNARWELVHTGGELYVTASGKTVSGPAVRGSLSG